MERFRDALNQVREQIELGDPSRMGRPTSLNEAGRTGSRTDQVRNRSDIPVEPVHNVEARRARPAAAVLPAQAPGARARIRSTLRSPVALRHALVMSEVLGAPVALRAERDGLDGVW